MNYQNLGVIRIFGYGYIIVWFYIERIIILLQLFLCDLIVEIKHCTRIRVCLHLYSLPALLSSDYLLYPLTLLVLILTYEVDTYISFHVVPHGAYKTDPPVEISITL